ncbi:MAG: ABC transporter permease subunit [Chloroflexi bacterium]|nr:ABC transporter permease subunit [Chloroflexota bacterium]
MKKILSITGKELKLYFGSPMALIFVGVFLVLTLFVFFWVDSFFARGIADVRALFAWMPLLMIFLVSALTMHQWSREEESGNLQVLLTMPVRLVELVAGKFLSALALVALALALTLFLPVTVSSLGNLDWGPVIGGYLAALLLASSYIAIGLFVSSRTNNQLVALIGTAVVCGLFQAVGSPVVTDLFGATTGDLLRQFGTGSRFESIERGVVDFRDLVYYLSLTIFFLALNIVSLDSKRWSAGAHLLAHRLNGRLSLALVGLNLLALNLLIAPLSAARLDLTQYNEYSLSDATKNLLADLGEPLLIRGYFSEDSHPALAPLVPRIKDTLREYQLAADGRLQLEFVDPLTNPEMEREANQIHGIRPSPLQVTDRGGVSLVNVYFDLLIAYGDQTASLNFSELIDIVDTPLGAEVRLRNLEYDLTSAIQRVVYGFQSLDAILAALEQPAQLTLYLSSATLPEWMAEVSQTMIDVTGEMADANPDKVAFSVVDMSAADVSVSEQELFDRYQIQPVATSFFATETFFLHLVIEAGADIQVIYPAGELSQADLRRAIESSLKRSSSGFLKVVGLWTPPPAGADQFGRQMPSLQQYSILEDALRENYELRRVTLEDGQLAADIDVLILLAPHGLTDIQRYAIDQYIMRGGSVIAAAGHYRLGIDPYLGTLQLDVNENGIQEMLASYGIMVGGSVVMDLQNAPFPVQVQRDVGDMVVSEIQALDYPFFADVRADKLDPDSPVVNSLQLLTMSWASPVAVAEAALPDARIATLIRSSDNAWESTNTNPEPDLQTYPDFGFPIGQELMSIPLAVAVEASFDSYFSDMPSPFEALESGEALDDGEPAAPEPLGLIERSPDNTRIIVLGSAEFVNDTVYQISASFGGDRFFNNIQLIANAIDWFTEDVSLASIRSRGSSARILPPIHESAQNRWVLINYAVAIIGLVLIGVVWQLQRRAEQPIQLLPPPGAATETRPPQTESADAPSGSDQGGF